MCILLITWLETETREQRKVFLKEQPGQKSFGRSTQVARAGPANQSRPLSADDIQKAKMRAQFMQQKYGKTGASSSEGHQVKVEAGNKVQFPQAKVLPPPQVQQRTEPSVLSSKAPVQPEVPPPKPCAEVPVETPPVDKMDLDPEEPFWRRCKRVQIQWHTPAEVKIPEDWAVGNGVDSKEVEIQKNRIRREKETVYVTSEDIPSDPKEPWDREIDYDDTLTLEIPIEQPPEPENVETVVSPPHPQGESSSVAPPPVVPPQNSNGGFPEPDLELLAELLKTPELVFALTAGQGGGSLSNEDIVKLLDLIKTNGVDSVVGSFTGLGRNAVANVPVSLPSPTPSSDPVTSGWRPETTANPFSRRTQTAAYSGGVQLRQTPPANAAAAQPPQAQPVQPPSQQAPSRLPQAPNFAPGSHHQPVNFQPTVAGSYGSPISQHPQNSELGNSMRTNNQFNRSQFPENSGYNKPVTVNRQHVTYHPHPDAALLHSPTPPRAQPQPSQHLVAPSLRHNPYSRPNPNNNQHNYNAMHHSGPPRDGGRFQTWGPEDNPNRYNEQMPGWRYQGPVQHSNRAEPGRWNPSEYRDFDRHGNDQRCRDHRRR